MGWACAEVVDREDGNWGAELSVAGPGTPAENAGTRSTRRARSKRRDRSRHQEPKTRRHPLPPSPLLVAGAEPRAVTDPPAAGHLAEAYCERYSRSTRSAVSRASGGASSRTCSSTPSAKTWCSQRAAVLGGVPVQSLSVSSQHASMDINSACRNVFVIAASFAASPPRRNLVSQFQCLRDSAFAHHPFG